MYQEFASGYSVVCGHLVAVLHPCVLGRLRRLDAVQAVRAQIRHAIGDPVHVLLDRHHHVAEHRRAARPGDHEHVREARGHQAEIGARPRLPFLPQRHAVGRGCRSSAARRSSHRSRWQTRSRRARTRRRRRARRVAVISLIGVERTSTSVTFGAVVCARSSRYRRRCAWCRSDGSSAPAVRRPPGSRTVSRILSRTNSAAVSLASLVDDQVVERGHEVGAAGGPALLVDAPPLRSDTSSADTSFGLFRMPVRMCRAFSRSAG